jgi:hypothetical protein
VLTLRLDGHHEGVMDTIKEFHLKRVEDESGVSGTGVVARGVILPSGAVVMEWQTFHSSICYYKNIGDVDAIHGHHGKTLVIMGPPPSEKTKKSKKKNEVG